MPGRLRALVGVGALALAVALSWPTAARLGTAAVGSPEADTAKHLWNLWWMRAEALHGTPGPVTRLVGFPEGLSLYPIEALHWPFVFLGPPVLVSNLLALAHLALLGWCGAWLGWKVSGSWAGALATGALAQGAATTAMALHVGVGELRPIWLVALGLGLLWRACEDDHPLAWAAVGVALAGAVLASFYLGLCLALGLACLGLARLAPSPGRVLGLAGAAGLALALSLPVVRAFSGGFGEDPAPVVRADGSLETDQRLEAAHLDHLLTPRSPLRASLDRQRQAYEGGRYLGWLPATLALAGLLARPRAASGWALLAAVATTLSLGTVLWWGDALVLRGERPVFLPGAWLHVALSRVAEPVNFPSRLLTDTTLAMAVLGGLAVARWRWLGLLVPLALVEVAWGDLVPFPRETTAPQDLTGLADHPGEGPLFDLAVARLPNVESRRAGIAAQLATHRATQAVPIERLDGWRPRSAAVALPLVIAADVTPEVVVASAAPLRALGFEALLLTGPRAQRGSPWDRALVDAWGEPTRAEGASLWTVPEGGP